MSVQLKMVFPHILIVKRFVSIPHGKKGVYFIITYTIISYRSEAAIK